MASAAEAAPKQPEKPDRALRVALYKGYTGEKAKCYADISRRYYIPGTITVPGRTSLQWKLELWNQCHISR
jgi:hypothetical protein